MPPWSPPLRGCLTLARSTTLQELSARQDSALRSLRPQIRQFTRPCHPTSGCTSPPHGCTSSSQPSSTFYILRLYRPSSSSLSYLQLYPPRVRGASSSSKWISRQSSDHFSREAKLQNLKSRAAFKLLQINERYRLFRPGMTVVDLGYAPGSWSQVAIDLVRPGVGRVVGVDIIPIQPPKGVNGIQGDFLSPEVQTRVREFLQDETRGRLRQSPLEEAEAGRVQEEKAGYLDRGRAVTADRGPDDDDNDNGAVEQEGKCVDVVLSDMSAPWQLNISPSKNSVSNPYRRMMNTTGNKFRDHVGSMDLCRAALHFAHDTLKVGGHLVCKFYQGAEDRQLERELRALFATVHREKPESSRRESREAFFVALKRRARVDRIVE